MGSTRQPGGLKVDTGNPLLQQVQAVVAPLGTAQTNNIGSSSSSSSSSGGRRVEETCQEYDRHLAWALEQDLADVVGTRALYVAGEDLKGRTCVVFCPDLAFLQQSPAAAAAAPPRNARKRRSNFATTTDGGGSDVKDNSPFSSSTSSSSPSPTSARRSPPVPRVAGALEKAAAVGASRISISRKNSSVAAAAAGGASRVNADPPITATTVTTEQRSSSNGDRGAAVALESNVGSAAVERLLLHFVRLLDEVADREYVLLLCGAGGKGGGGGWLSWGRFSMLGEMHSLLPRRHKKNLKGLVVLQPSPVLHSFFEFANLFLSPKFYRKLEFCGGLAELASKFPSKIMENLPEGALSVKAEMGRQVTPSPSSTPTSTAAAIARRQSSSSTPRLHGSSGNLAAQGEKRGSTPTGDDGRPSPVRITRVFGGGLQVQGDETWTPPPLPPPPLQSAPRPASPLLRNGGTRVAAIKAPTLGPVRIRRAPSRLSRDARPMV